MYIILFYFVFASKKLTAAADPQTFSGPRAPPRFSAMPNASFSACFTLVTRDPKIRYSTQTAHPRHPKVDHKATPNIHACRRPEKVNHFCLTARPKSAKAVLVPSPVKTLEEWAAKSGRVTRARRERVRRASTALDDQEEEEEVTGLLPLVAAVAAVVVAVVVGLVVVKAVMAGKGRREEGKTGWLLERRLVSFLQRAPRGPDRKPVGR